MKKGIHPELRDFVFVERATGFKLLTKSTLGSKETVEIDGKEYPFMYIDISASSHPFYTGEQKLIKTGAVDKFYARLKKSENLKK